MMSEQPEVLEVLETTDECTETDKLSDDSEVVEDIEEETEEDIPDFETFDPEKEVVEVKENDKGYELISDGYLGYPKFTNIEWRIIESGVLGIELSFVKKHLEFIGEYAKDAKSEESDKGHTWKSYNILRNTLFGLKDTLTDYSKVATDNGAELISGIEYRVYANIDKFVKESVFNKDIDSKAANDITVILSEIFAKQPLTRSDKVCDIINESLNYLHSKYNDAELDKPSTIEKAIFSLWASIVDSMYDLIGESGFDKGYFVDNFYKDIPEESLFDGYLSGSIMTMMSKYIDDIYKTCVDNAYALKEVSKMYDAHIPGAEVPLKYCRLRCKRETALAMMRFIFSKISGTMEGDVKFEDVRSGYDTYFYSKFENDPTIPYKVFAAVSATATLFEVIKDICSNNPEEFNENEVRLVNLQLVTGTIRKILITRPEGVGFTADKDTVLKYMGEIVKRISNNARMSKHFSK